MTPSTPNLSNWRLPCLTSPELPRICIAVRRDEGDGTWVYTPILEPLLIRATRRRANGETHAVAGDGTLIDQHALPDLMVAATLHFYLEREGWIVILP